MKTRNFITTVLVICISVLLFSFELPSSWFIAGTKPKSYEMGIDKGAGKNSKNAATIKSIEPVIDGFGTLMQDCVPDKFLGKRIQMTGWLRSDNVSKWAGLWLRIDTKTSVKAITFDNMFNGNRDRAVKGTTNWKKYVIILDVPLNSSNISYDALLVGTGQIWIDKLSFEIVSTDVPVTGVEMESSGSTYSSHRKEPENLDFEN